MTNMARLGTISALALAASAQSAFAVTWTDFTTVNATTASGTAGVVGVTVSGDLNLVYSQVSGGIDYWAYSGFAGFQPTNTDFIALGTAGVGPVFAGLKTIAFSVPVTDVYLAIGTWNVAPFVALPGADTTFSNTFTSLVGGTGYFSPANGFFIPNVAPGGSGTNTLTGTYDEVNGVLLFSGTFSSITFTDTNENYHGFTVGYGSVANIVVPEPSAWMMMLTGFGILGSALRRPASRRVRLQLGR